MPTVKPRGSKAKVKPQSEEHDDELDAMLNEGTEGTEGVEGAEGAEGAEEKVDTRVTLKDGTIVSRQYYETYKHKLEVK